MIIAIGSVLLLAAICLLGVAVLLPSAPAVPLDRRRPFEPEPPSSLSRLALSGVRSFERLLAGRNVKLFSRAELENAGLRLSQAEFFLLVGIGACVGMLVGTVTVGPLVGVLLACWHPSRASSSSGSLPASGAARSTVSWATHCSCSPAASGPATASCAPSTPPPRSPRSRHRRRCGG